MKKILILEDEKEVAQLYAKFLNAKGYATVLAHNGIEGLEKLKTMEPDLILLDLSMPHMNGMEFFQRICGPDEKPKYPVLVLTARMDLESVFKGVHVDGFIVKPFQKDALLKDVEVILNKQYFKKNDGNTRSIVVIDDNDKCSEEISHVFSQAGYQTTVATSGISGIETIMANPPDLAIVSLSLNDISGDLVILRLQQMAKTKHVNYILYVKRDHDHNKAVMDNMSQKMGVKLLCEYSDPKEILNGAIKIFQGAEQDVPAFRG